jgi:hypothetical protein
LSFIENNGGPTVANGQIDVVGGIAVSGFLNVTGGPGSGFYALVAVVPSGISSFGSFTYDNAVAPGSTPFIPRTGLLWATGDIEFNMFYNFSTTWGGAAGTYGLLGNLGSTVDHPRRYGPVASGTATLTAVPDTGVTITLLSGALVALALMRRRFEDRR